MEERQITAIMQKLSEMPKRGASHADLFVQTGTAHSAHYEDGRMDELASSGADGSGARIITDGKTFYSHSPGTSPYAISRILDETERAAFGSPAPFSERGREAILQTEDDISMPDVTFMRDLDASVRKRSALVKQVSFRYSISKRRILIMRSDGIRTEETRTYGTFSVRVVTGKNGSLNTAYERRSMSVQPSEFWAGSNPESIAITALDRALLMTDARPCPAGKMKVLLSGDSGGTVIHEACGHGLEADVVEKDRSVYMGKLGKRVAHPSVTMIDDPTIPALYGSYKYDDEGTPAARNVLIENGVLKRYLTDIHSAMSSGLPLTGNGRRQTYRNVPVPRMSNTFLLPGDSDFESMLSQTEDGLLVKKMGGGEVDPTSGDFVFHVSEAYIIEKGRISYPVKGATLTGNGPAVLENILALGKDLCMEPGICGKSGQGVPVTDGQPSMLIGGMTVGGSVA